MKAYKFEVMIQEDGIIQIPEISRFANQEAEIFIMVKPKVAEEADRLQAANQFLDKWRGILKGFDPDDLKRQYLQEKYK